MSSVTAEASESSIKKRLPTNQRRRKVPTELRKRTARACNACNVRRVKCSGEQPCARCISGSRTCEYPPETEKIIVPKETYEDLQNRCLTLQQCLADAVPAERNREVLITKWTKSSKGFSASVKPPSSRSEDCDDQETGNGRILQDPEGYTRYLGESSGAAFMDRLREFVATVVPLLSQTADTAYPSLEGLFTSHLGQYHTHDSKPLLLPHVDPFYLPSSEEINKMLTVFRYYAEDGAGAAPCGGIYYWGNLWELEEKAGKLIPLSGSRDESILLCKLNAVLALACQYDPSLALPWESQPGETYFARAKMLLINPMEDASLAYMCTLCLMGYYLLGLYRRDAAYLYIGLASRISVIHGLHKGWMISNQDVSGEQRKREFWNTFILDRWLSSLMGRPAMLPEEAITVDLPVDMTDTMLPPVAGLREHAKLSRIMNEIVDKVYGNAASGVAYSQVLSRVDEALEHLSVWKAELPPSLQREEDGKIADRARITLHLQQNQLIILCTRPLLFQAVKQLVAVRYSMPIPQRQLTPSYHHLTYCADAARRVTDLLGQLIASKQTALLASVEYHYPFNSAIVLELSRILPAVSLPGDEERIKTLVDYLRLAGEKGNESAADCRRMVLEFGTIVNRILLDIRMHRRTTSTPPIPLLAPNNSIDGYMEGPHAGALGRDLPLSSSQMILSDIAPVNMAPLREGQVVVYEKPSS